jgi:sialate O-acetylesterase
VIASQVSRTRPSPSLQTGADLAGKRRFALFAFFIFVAVLRAEVKLAGVFGDHMVLQQGIPLTVWGFANSEEKITVQIADQTVTTKGDGNGRWHVIISPLRSTAKTVSFNVSGENKLTLEDILIGDVWLCTGQSNMVYSLGKDQTAPEELPKADHADIRLCQISPKAMREPLTDRQVKWVVCTPADAKRFSAVGYFFGREIQNISRSPVGLILSAVSGTPAQSWTSLDALKSDPELKTYLTTYEQMKDKSGPNDDPKTAVPGTPTSLFNGMISPLIPFGLKGVIWYQGESNTSEAELYRTLFSALIDDWRKRWNQGDFPFLFVQLPGFNRRKLEPSAFSSWALLREAQAKTLAMPNTGMAVTVDLSPTRNILHPPNKKEVGHRLALLAARIAYGQDIACYGPTYKASLVTAHNMRVTFDHVGSGLVVGAPSSTDPNQPVAASGLQLKGFSLAGPDLKFVRAEAVLDGESVIVSSEKVDAPVAVRYGWDDNPEVNLYNKEGLPAVPFRTDSWKDKSADQPNTTQSTKLAPDPANPELESN